MNAPAQLDNRNRARKDEEMDSTHDTLRSEISNGCRESHRREMQESVRLIEARIEQLSVNVDVHFRWLKGLMPTSILGTVGILIKLM